ncbi:hypothetical protein SANTM175S_01146 [Streptomyces antimycoticus]
MAREREQPLGGALGVLGEPSGVQHQQIARLQPLLGLAYVAPVVAPSSTPSGERSGRPVP